MNADKRRFGKHFLTTITAQPGGLMMLDVDENDSQQHGKQNRHEEDEAVSCYALFVTQRTQALNSARGEVVHEFGIVGGRPAEMVANPPEQRRQIIFAHSEV